MDLTVPYTESGVSMVVPIKDTKRNLQGISGFFSESFVASVSRSGFLNAV